MADTLTPEEEKQGWHIHIDDEGNVTKHQHHHVAHHGDMEGEHHHEHHGESAHSHHGHTHSHAHTKAVLNRMSKLIGHLKSIQTMIENGRDCSDVLIQISAVSGALNKVGKLILKDHMEHCIVDAVRENDEKAIKKLEKAIDLFIR